MFVGHYSTALVAQQQLQLPKGSLLYLLIVSQLQDFLWFTFDFLGLEPTQPGDVFSTTLSNMSVNMLYSHDLLPQIAWCVVIFLVGKLLFKNTKIALAGVLLIIGHFVLDFFSGHPHHIFGLDTHSAGLGLYATNVYLAIGIEILFTAAMLWLFFSSEAKAGIKRTTANKASIIGVFIFGIVFLLFIAKTSFRQWFGLPEFDPGFNTTVPMLLSTYLGMTFYLNYLVGKPMH